MQEREAKLLKAIIESHIKTARPVGSQGLASKDFDLSPATIRNEMAVLEDQGLITQPYTSAGRIPTVAGYQYYLDHLLSIKKSSPEEIAEIKNAYHQDIRDLAKLLAHKTHLACVAAMGPHDFYFTGLFNLFSQVEFEDYKMVLSMSQVVDSLEKAMADIYHTVKSPQILLGRDNPFSDQCAVAVTPMPETRLLAILGPLRMDYNKVLGLLNSIENIHER